MTTGGLWWLARGVPLYNWGPRQYLNALIVCVVSVCVTACLYRLNVWRQSRNLAEERSAHGWQWACLARIRVGEQLVFGPGVRPIFKGPVGTFLFDGEHLAFIPNKFCRRRGYVARSWPATDVQVIKEGPRRDVTGFALRDVELLLSGYRVRAFMTHEVGDRPASLQLTRPVTPP